MVLCSTCKDRLEQATGETLGNGQSMGCHSVQAMAWHGCQAQPLSRAGSRKQRGARHGGRSTSSDARHFTLGVPCISSCRGGGRAHSAICQTPAMGEIELRSAARLELRWGPQLLGVQSRATIRKRPRGDRTPDEPSAQVQRSMDHRRFGRLTDDGWMTPPPPLQPVAYSEGAVPWWMTKATWDPCCRLWAPTAAAEQGGRLLSRHHLIGFFSGQPSSHPVFCHGGPFV